MRIYIPTRGRAARMTTATTFYEACIPFTLALTKGDPDIPKYKKWCAKHEIYADYEIYSVDSLVEKRNGILNHEYRVHRNGDSDGKFMMIDDDLTFFARGRKWHKADADDVRNMIAWFENVLGLWAHAGIVDKFMCQSRPRGESYHGRYSGVLGYNVANFPTKPRPEFRMFVNEEHDMHLQLATRGREPVISNEFSRDQKYYARGGFDYRTKKNELAGHKEFAKAWPGYVTIKESKNARSGVRVQVKWAQAVKDGNHATKRKAA